MTAFSSSQGRPAKAAAALVVTLALFAGIPEVSAETLEQALAMAYESNPTLMARRAQLRAADESVPQALSGWRPKVTMSGDVARSQSYSNTRSSPTSRSSSSPGRRARCASPSSPRRWSTRW